MLLFLIVIYLIIVTILYGLIGQGITKYRPDLADNFKCTTATGASCDYKNIQGGYSDSLNPVNKISFFTGIAVTFNSAPWWLQAIIFTPLLVMLGWLVLVILLHGG